MKNYMAILFALGFLFPAAAFARIGETLAQCETRYGKAYNTEGSMSAFRKGGLLIGVVFYQGKADVVYYEKEERNIVNLAAEMSENEIETLLKANGGDKKWKKSAVISMDKHWQTEEGELFANYTTIRSQLTVCTREYLEREFEKTKAKEKKQLEGF